MHFPRNRTALLLFLALLGAAAAGCARFGSTTPDGAPTAAPAASPTAAGPTAAAEPATPEGDWRSYHDARLGLSFEVPARWEPVESGGLQGPGGFVLVERLTADGAARAALCQTEANRDKPARFGAYPEIVEVAQGAAGDENWAGGLPGCLILPSPDQPAGRGSEALALLWSAPTAQAIPRADYVLALRASSAHIHAIAQSLRLDSPPGDTAPGAAAGSACNFDLEDSRAERLRQGGLRVDLFPIARGAGCSPIDDPLAFDQRAQAGPPAARAAAVLAGQWSQERLARLNTSLKPFGFLVETYDQLFRVIKDNQVLRDNINWIGQMTVKEDESDFLLPMIDSYNAAAFLLRPFGVEPLEQWDLLLFDNIFPIYVGDARVRLAYDYQRYPRPSGSPALVQVIRDEEVIDTISVSGANPAGGPVRGLWAWQDGWLLELPGVLIQDGVTLNDTLNYSEMFAWRLLGEKPFYLFRQDGKVQASYSGQALALDFDEVLYEPQWTTAMLLQIKKYENGLLFYARRGDIWYYVVIEAE